MDSRKFQFLKAVLGEDGARALAKAAERGPELENALLPRTIMAWLGIAGRADYEGTVPGVENTYLQFAKSEDRYSGSVSVGDEVYSFKAATMLHLGACVAVALGADHERISPGLRDLDVQRLGKNIDTLVKARIAVAELRKMRAGSDDLRKAIGAIAPGKAMGAAPEAGHDYSHILAPEHRAAGYSLHVKPALLAGRTFGLTGELHHNGAKVGHVQGHLEGDGTLDTMDAVLDPAHRGKGLGTHMYESVMAHGFHNHGVTQMIGGSHSTAASKVHTAISQKHGLGYQPTPKPGAEAKPQGDYDGKLGGYQYAIKAELEMSKGEDIFETNKSKLRDIARWGYKRTGGPDDRCEKCKNNGALFSKDKRTLCTNCTHHDHTMNIGFNKAAKPPQGGAEAPGPAHAPTGPTAPLAPIAPDPTQNSKGPVVSMHPKPPKLPTPKASTDVVQTGMTQKAPKAKPPTLAVSKSQSEAECPVCGGHQFKADQFRGCICFRDLAKSVKVTVTETGYNLEFKADWDQDSILTLLESLGKN